MPILDYAALASALSVPDGGFTVSVATGEHVTTGYAVSAWPELECRLSGDVPAGEIARYVSDVSVALSLPGSVLGGWRDPESGDVFLDVSTVVTTERTADALACRYGQLAYFDLDRGVSVTVQPAAAQLAS